MSVQLTTFRATAPRPTELIAMVAIPLLGSCRLKAYAASLLAFPPCPTTRGHPFAGFGESGRNKSK